MCRQDWGLQLSLLARLCWRTLWGGHQRVPVQPLQLWGQPGLHPAHQRLPVRLPQHLHWWAEPLSSCPSHSASRWGGGSSEETRPCMTHPSPKGSSSSPWTMARLVPLSMGFSKQEYWSGLLFPSPGDLPDPGIKPGSLALQADSLPSEPPGKATGSRWRAVCSPGCPQSCKGENLDQLNSRAQLFPRPALHRCLCSLHRCLCFLRDVISFVIY